ncbi:MAG: formylglycine-generating enzyme family protein, partial [Myxococcota bacterium]
EYTKWLSQHTGQQYRLPTEAQWEYAARGNTTTRYWWGNQEPVCQKGVRNGAKFDDNASCDDTGTEVIGSYQANAYGLYDVHGNVWEWTCSDHHNSYDGNEGRCSSKNQTKVLRGGSWGIIPRYLRAAVRSYVNPDVRIINIGFRVVRFR